MPQSIVRVQVTLAKDGALPEDSVVNTMHFDGDVQDGVLGSPWTETSNDLMPGLLDRVVGFYQATQALLSARLAGTGLIKVYDMNEDEPRTPRAERSFTFSPGTTALPSELAICISFRGARASGANMARRTGRIYFGPLIAGWAGPSTSGNDEVVNSTSRGTLLTAFEAMATGSTGGAYRLAIFSPTTYAATNNLDLATEDAVECWIDNAFDVQRRRGTRPTTRNTLAIS